MRGDETTNGLTEEVAELVDLASEQLGQMSVRLRTEGFVKLDAARLRRKRGSAGKRRLRFLSLAAVPALAAVLLVGRWHSQHRDALSYAVDGGRVGLHGVVETNGTTEPILRFSDGTQVILLAGARGHVRSTDEHGARVVVEGKAKVEVVHWRGSHWLFDVGPYLITVTGTSFTAEWKAQEEQLEVVLKTGTVAVSGPLSDEAITLRAGQQLIISMREKEVLIRDIDSTGESGAAASAVASGAPRPWGEEVDGSNGAARYPEVFPAESPARRSVPSTGGHATKPDAPTASNWRAELSAGRFVTILQEAEQRGLERALGEASSDDLAAFADAARYSRRDDLARIALTAQRRRFAKSARANDAAFLLGRLEETGQHLELALAWYDRYLAESPSGTYTAEALGRKMTVVQRLSGPGRARPIADEYLRLFEKGPYAAAARALTRAP